LASSRGWRIAEWSLLLIWVVAGVMTMYPEVAQSVGLRRSLFTSHAADLTQPAWLYIVTRRSSGLLGRVFGRTPELAAATVFGAATIAEITQRFWPRGLFSGTFDPLDIIAYAIGVGLCWLADRRTQN
jgi:hypothetical protein